MAAEQSGGALCSGGAVPGTPSNRLPRWPFAGYIPPARYRLATWDYSLLAPVDPDTSEQAKEQRELAFAALDARREWQRQLGATLLRNRSHEGVGCWLSAPPLRVEPAPVA